MPSKRSQDTGTYVQIVGDVVQIATGEAGFDDDQAGKLLAEIARRAKKVRGVRRANISLVEKTLNIVPAFVYSNRDQVRQAMQALIAEITKIFRQHLSRAARSKRGLIPAGA